MKIQKKISLCVFLIIISSSTIPYASSWSHGYESYPYATFPIDYTPSRHYGISDWIAKGVMMTLYQNDTFQWQWLDVLRVMYYIGTESIANPDVHMSIDGVEVKGNDYRDDFRVTVSVVNGTYSYDIPSMEYIEDAFQHFKDALVNESYYLSAYYMGRFIAFLSLLGYYPVYMKNGNVYRQYEWYYNDILQESVSLINDTKYYTWNNVPFSNVSLSECSSQLIEDNLLYPIETTETSVTLRLDWINTSKPYPETESRDDWHSDSTTEKYAFYSFHEKVFNDIIHYASSLCKIFADEIDFEGAIIDEAVYNFKGMDERTIIIVVSLTIGTFFSSIIYMYRKKIKHSWVNREHLHFNRVKKVKKRKLRKKKE